MKKLLILTVVACLSFTSLSFAGIPEYREMKIYSAWRNLIELTTYQNPVKGDVQYRVGDFGVNHATKHEFLFVTGRDFYAGFTVVPPVMVLTMDVPKLKAEAGLRKLKADGMSLDVMVVQNADYSRVAIKIPGAFARVPFWHYMLMKQAKWKFKMETAYPNYQNDKPFCLKTVKAVLLALEGSYSDAMLPNYYAIQYSKKAIDLSKLTDGRDPSFHNDPIACVLVAVRPDMTQGHLVKDPVLFPKTFFMTSHKNHRAKLYLGAFGIKYGNKKTEIMWQDKCMVCDDVNYRAPMVTTVMTPKRIPAPEGESNFTADGQPINARVTHAGNQSRIDFTIPKEYNRTPSWWMNHWKPIENSKYQGSETFLLSTTVSEVLKHLAGSTDGYMPNHYEVRYVKNFTTLSAIDPTKALSLQFKSHYNVTPVLANNVKIRSVRRSLSSSASKHLRIVPMGNVHRIEYFGGNVGASHVNIYNLFGARLAKLPLSNEAGDIGQVSWDSSRIPHGIYIVEVESGGLAEWQRLIKSGWK